ncbi:MAG: hypothetical protein RLZ62_1444, partial [Bacteroidota bacterium]
MKKYGKKVLLGLLGVLLIIQFIHPEKNDSGATPGDIAGKYSVPDEVMSVLKPACYDCHSNQTRYPWYASIQPVAWWLAEHVNDGKKHLNFHEFTTRKIAVQNHKLEEIVEMVKEEEMPLGSYTWTHADARLTDAQRELIVNWAQSA